MEKFFNLEKMGLSTVFKSLHIQIDKAVTIFGFFYLIAAKANLAETFFMMTGFIFLKRISQDGK